MRKREKLSVSVYAPVSMCYIQLYEYNQYSLVHVCTWTARKQNKMGGVGVKKKKDKTKK